MIKQTHGQRLWNAVTEQIFGDLVATAPSGTGKRAAHEIAGGQF